jgi:hypothetical protein
MGLCLTVGYLADVQREDPEMAADFGERIKAVETCLERQGLAGYREPPDLPEEDWFSCEMFGYSGLHHLRRLAAYVALEQALYAPSGDVPDDDPVVERYYETVGDGDSGSLLFQHLMLHGDSEGLYVPVDFARVIDPGELAGAAGGAIGSAHRLLAECKALARVLGLPQELDCESDEVWEAADNPGVAQERWKTFGIESFSCLRLMRGCEASIKTGAALVFC